MILGVDPGTAIIGFAFVEGTQQNPEIVSYGVLETAPRPVDQFPGRLLEIAEDFEALLIKYKPIKCVIEDLFFFKNQKTIITVAQSRGLMLYLLAKHGIEVVSMTPLQVKQTLCGYGRAKKIQVQKMTQKLYKLKELPKPDDAADALGMAWCGL